jgi:hypothetical protein
MTDDDGALIDPHRSACLCDQGAPDLIAATVVDCGGHIRLVLVRRDRLGDPTARYDPATPDAVHEQLGPLPLDFARRLTIASRRLRRRELDQ